MIAALRGRTGMKLWIVRSLVSLVIVDAGLGLYLWRTAAAHPQSERAALEQLRARHKQFGNDVARAESIADNLPKVERECNHFYEEQFLSSSKGYSAVVEDLGRIAKEAGLPPSTIAFKQQELGKRGVVEVEVTATVAGEYPALVRFVNGLERSEHLYLLDALSLGAEPDKHVKLSLVMKTYFRAAA
jgi:hypothetical protein